MRFSLPQAAWVMLLSTWLLLPAHAVDVRAIRLWASPEGTRVVLDLSGSAQHSLQILKNPDRVVLDVAGARLAAGARGAPAGAGIVKEVRMGRRPSGELRIVLDLTRPIQAKSFLAAPNDRYGYRLVIDLGQSQSAETPVKAEHAPPDARDLIIAVDAGHGGEDPGAIGKNGTREKDVVLAIARELATEDQCGAGDEGRAHAQRRLLRAAARSHAARARAIGGSVRLDSRRFDSRPARRRILGVHPVAARRDRRGLALARRARKRVRPDRRRIFGRQGRCARLGASGSVAVGIVERQPGGGGARAARTVSRRRGPQAPSAAGALRGAEVPRHSVDVGGDGLYFESAGGDAAA